MTVEELMDQLGDFGDHLTVVFSWDEDSSQTVRVIAGRDADGMAACVLRIDD